MDSINKIFQVVEYMNLHIDEELSVEEFCNISGYSKSHFINLYTI